MTMSREIFLQKQDLRNTMRKRHMELNASIPQAAKKVRDLFLRHITLPKESLIALTVAQNGELDPLPLGLALLEQQHRLCLPIVTGKNKPLLFRAWKPGDSLKTGKYNILEPLPSADIIEPDVLLIPLLAFDRQGNRLGQGGGYYDRTLASLRGKTKILAIGLGFAAQQVPIVPCHRNDQRLNIIVTENEIIRMNGV